PGGDARRSARADVRSQGPRRSGARDRAGAGRAARPGGGGRARNVDELGAGVRSRTGRPEAALPVAAPIRAGGAPIDPARIASLCDKAHGVLAGNWREGHLADGTPYGFTCPAPPRYRHQWYWDSCFHAIVWRHFQPARAREELRTLLRGGRLD